MFGLVLKMWYFVLCVDVFRGDFGLVIMMMCLVGLMLRLWNVVLNVCCCEFVFMVEFDFDEMMSMVLVRFLLRVVSI